MAKERPKLTKEKSVSVNPEHNQPWDLLELIELEQAWESY